MQIHAKLTVVVKSLERCEGDSNPFLHRLGFVAMLCLCMVLHLSRPVEFGGDCDQKL